MDRIFAQIIRPRNLLVVALLGALCWFISMGPRDSTKERSRNIVVGTERDVPPSGDLKIEELTETLLSQSSESQKLLDSLNDRLEALGEYYARELRGISPDQPEWIESSFEAFGVDRDKIGIRHDGSEIKIGRWKASDTAPNFSGETAFQEFFQNSLMAWKQADQFGIQFKIYSTKVTDDEIVANVVADIYGQVKLDRGRQATSLWQTKWTRGVKDKLMLKSVGIQAQEEIVVNVPGGLLLQDCTESIFNGCTCYKRQLQYGLDQWARQIPGLNVVGNQGVAIGDVNNDGLDDLYVCQGHGLPNQLLLQNPDGTVREHSRIADVDVMDESRSALIVDLDNDGDQDLVVTTDDHVILFSNKGEGRFELERKLSIGFGGHSISAADFDQDGDLDLFVCKYQRPRDSADLNVIPESYVLNENGGRNILLRNDEGWNFSDVTEIVGITENNSGCSRSAAWVDIDSDGDQDLLVTNEWASSRCYENQSGWFSDITEKLKMDMPGQNRSVSIGEFNQDGRPDLFIATNVTTEAYHTIRENEKVNEKLTDQSAAMLSLSHFWQSEDPKLPDAAQTNAQGTLTKSNSFQRTPKAAFRHYPLRVPIFTSESSFSSTVADLNNDGLDDVLVTNGYLTRTSSEDLESLLLARVSDFDPARVTAYTETLSKARDVLDLVRTGFSFEANQRNRAYISLGPLGFANFSAASGIDLLNDARAIATTDWDGDGDTDVVMTSRNGPQIRLFCNQMQTDNGYLKLDLEGTRSNRDAIGAKIEIYIGKSAPLVKILSAGSGNLSQSSKRITFGLGTAKLVEKAIVVWPNGDREEFTGLLPNRHYRLVEGSNTAGEISESRFELEIKPRSLRKNIALPEPIRSVFFPPSALPRISIVDQEDNWLQIKSRDDKPTLVVFCTNNAQSSEFLKSIASKEESMDEVDLDCVAVITGNEQAGNRQENADARLQNHLRNGQQLIDESGFPFLWGAASEESMNKMQLLCGHWFSHQQLPRLPFAILLDKADQVKAFYPSTELAIKDVINDKPLFVTEKNQAREKRFGYNGRWMSPYRYTDLLRLKDRFLDMGLEEDAMLLNGRSKSHLAKSLTQRAIELASQREFENSKVFFDRAIDVDPNCVLAYIGQGQLLRDVAARQKIEDEAIKLEMLANAGNSYQFALDVDPFNVDAAIGLANVAIDENRTSKAIEQLDRYMEFNPKSAEMKAIMGRLLFARKEYRESAEFLTSAFDLHPTLPFVAGDLGFLYLSAGEYKQARKFLRLAQRLQPSDKNVIRLLAEAELVTGNYEKAVELFEDVVKLHPDRVRPKNVLAWLLVTSPFEEHRDADRARKMIEPLVEMFGENSPTTLEISAACFAEQGDFEKAISLQEQAMDLLRQKASTDKYSDEQKKGLVERLELYRRKRPYRSNDLAQLPFKKPGNRNKK